MECFDFENYARQMRTQLSNKLTTKEDGNINHAYFLAKKGAYWSPDHERALVRGIQLFGK